MWGIRVYEVVGCRKLDPNFLAVSIRGTPAVVRCPRCGTKDVDRKGTQSRVFRGLPVGRKQVWFEAQVPRVRCDRCQITRQVRISFAAKGRRHMRSFERYALDLTQIATTADAARHLAAAWDTVRDIGRFWQQPNKALAAQWLADWLHDADASGIRLLPKFAKTLASRRQSP